MKFSVLMTVYRKDNPEYFKQAINSIIHQTVKSDNIVLVCDGPLTDALNIIIDQTVQQYGDIFTIVRLETNQGLGIAINHGLAHCMHELVARMDSDDISRYDRFEKQLKVFSEMPEIGICSGIVEEFSTVIDNVDIYNVPPETHNEIISYAQRFNPFNHPCVMFKKSEVVSAGSYQDFYLLEDYFLWVRMLMNGSKGYNIQQPLLWMRAGNEMYHRRSGWKYINSQLKLFYFMYSNGFSSLDSCVYSCVMRVGACLAPNWLRELGIKMILRKKKLP